MKNLPFIKVKIIYIALLVFVVMQVLACKTTVAQEKSERNVPEFNDLNLCISANVIIRQGSAQKLDIQASDRLLQLIETEVNNGKLTIKWTEKFVRNTENIKIYITMLDIKGLHIAGSGDIVANEAISCTDIDLSISGSGSIKLDNLKAENVKSSISGSADIVISGSSTVTNLQANISGSGDIKASGLPVKNIAISVSGSGNCSVNAIETLKARVAGSGDVFYTGTAVVDAKVAGSGSVKHVN